MIQIINILSKFGLDITQVEIEESYSEPHRFYHTLSHIEFLIEKIIELFEKGSITEDERDVLILTALFHDIIYNPQRTDNEIQSVNFLKSKLFNKITPEIQKVCDIILATSSHKKTGDKLTDIFCDLDMWFLTNGSFMEILADERKIFKEYQFVDYKTYKEERTKFLTHILNTTYGVSNKENIQILIDWLKTGVRDNDGYLSLK